MIIIAGYIKIAPEKVQEALETGKKYVEPVRSWKGCIEYTWTADLVDPGRIYVYELWEDEESLAAHFQGPHYKAMGAHMGSFGLGEAGSIQKFRIDLAEPVYDDTFTPRADFFTEKS